MSDLIGARQARIFGPFIMALGVLALATAIWGLLAGGEDGVAGRLAVALFAGLFGALLLVGGRMIAARRGGVAVESDAYVLRGDSADDQVIVPLARCRGILMHRVDERRGTELVPHWVCEAILRDAPRMIVGESDDEHAVGHVAHQIAAAGGLGTPLEEHPGGSPSRPEPPAPGPIEARDDGMSLHVGASGNLHATLLVGGAAMLVSGVVLMVDIANNNVLGFLFGPLLIAIGVIFGSIPLIKRLLIEHMRVEPGTLHHEYESLGFRWGHRAFALSEEAYVRVRQRGLHGANLEVVSQGRILHVAGGVHRRTRMGPDGLFWAGQHLSWLLAAHAGGKAPSQDSMQNS